MSGFGGSREWREEKELFRFTDLSQALGSHLQKSSGARKSPQSKTAYGHEAYLAFNPRDLGRTEGLFSFLLGGY